MQHLIRLQSGETFACDEESNVLAAMERARCTGIPVGCRNGGCGACRIRVIAGGFRTGRMNRAVVSEAEQAEGIALACRTFPESAIDIEVLGRAWQGRTSPRDAWQDGFNRMRPISTSDKET